MDSLSISFLLIILIIMVSFLEPISSLATEKCPEDNPQKVYRIGAIIDSSSRPGREEKVAMKIARADFCSEFNSNIECPELIVNDFLGSTLDHHPHETASLANTMMKDNDVKAILLRLESWHEALIVAKLGNKSQVPILSLANDMVPNWAYQYLPYLINAAPSQRYQMKAVSAIIRTWQWKRANIIYEDIDSVTKGVTPYLIQELQKVGTMINTLLPIPPNLGISSQNMTSHLETLKDNMCRVYIVHTNSLTLAEEIFKAAKRLGLMEADSVWITTASLTNKFDHLGSFRTKALQGVLGVKSYISKSGKRYDEFFSKFMAQYALEYPWEPNLEPGIFALQAYDAAFALSLALKGQKPNSGREILEKILKVTFLGFFGHLNFNQSVLWPAHIFEIVNVAGKSYNEIGFWTEGLGFSEQIQVQKRYYNYSMRILGQVVWPGRPWMTPSGGVTARMLRIGVPNKTTFNEFVKVQYDNKKNPSFSGYSIDVFLKVVDLGFPYKFIPINASSYDLMVRQVQLEEFDAVVADLAIVAERCNYVQFSQPYAESGVQMLIYNQPRELHKDLLFLAPFNWHLWLSTFFINMYNGLALYWVEREQNPEFREGSKWNQLGTLFASAFKTLFSLQGPMLKRNSTRLAFVIWLFVCVVLIQTYTASLTTLLTDQNRPPATIDIQTLRRTGAKVGCDANSFVSSYLEKALEFKSENIVKINSGDEYPEALEKGRIKAAFLEVPYVKLFKAKHCEKFVLSGQPFKVGGFGFAFSKNSPYLPNVSQAILRATESGILQELEKKLYSTYNCSSASERNGENGIKIGLGSFYVLFLVTGIATTFPLLKHVIWRNQEDRPNDDVYNDHDHDYTCDGSNPTVDMPNSDHQVADHGVQIHQGPDDEELSCNQHDQKVIDINSEPS